MSELSGRTHTVSKSQLVLEGGDLICHYLEQIGVEYVFGIPGGPLVPFLDALARSEQRNGLQTVVSRHETGAAFMADGYARESGKLGVCYATTGPGATNMITGVASAYQENIPLLVITAQTSLPTFGRKAVQESSCTSINTVGMYEYCTRYNTFVSHAAQLERKLVTAIVSALNSPNGPVHLSIPFDVMRTPIKSRKLSYNLAELISKKKYIDEESIALLYTKITKSKKLVFLIGRGCGGSIGAILELALLIDAVVVTTPQGKGLVSVYHPKYKGVFGIAGHKSAYDAISDPSIDHVISIGNDFDEQASLGWDESLLNKRLIHIDNQIENFLQSPEAQMHVLGDLQKIFEILLDRLYKEKFKNTFNTNNTESVISNTRLIPSKNTNNDMGITSSNSRHVQTAYNSVVKSRLKLVKNTERKDSKPCDDYERVYGSCDIVFNDTYKIRDNSSPIKPQRLMYELSRLFPPNTRFLADIGNSFLWAIHYLQPADRRIAGCRSKTSETLKTSMGFASMGWAIGGAIGTALGCPGQPVVSIVGDGSFLMVGQEITVAVENKLPIFFIVLNDSSLGTIRHGQNLLGVESIGHELPTVNFFHMAQSMGALGYQIKSSEDFNKIDIAKLADGDSPVLFDIVLDREEIPPLASRIKVLSFN